MRADIKEDQILSQAYAKIFDQQKAKRAPLFCSPNGNWYIFVRHRTEGYLEPNKFKKSFDQKTLNKMIEDFYHFIRFSELLNDKIFIPNKRH